MTTNEPRLLGAGFLADGEAVTVVLMAPGEDTADGKPVLVRDLDSSGSVLVIPGHARVGDLDGGGITLRC